MACMSRLAQTRTCPSFYAPAAPQASAGCTAASAASAAADRTLGGRMTVGGKSGTIALSNSYSLPLGQMSYKDNSFQDNSVRRRVARCARVRASCTQTAMFASTGNCNVLHSMAILWYHSYAMCISCTYISFGCDECYSISDTFRRYYRPVSHQRDSNVARLVRNHHPQLITHRITRIVRTLALSMIAWYIVNW